MFSMKTLNFTLAGILSMRLLAAPAFAESDRGRRGLKRSAKWTFGITCSRLRGERDKSKNL